VLRQPERRHKPEAARLPAWLGVARLGRAWCRPSALVGLELLLDLPLCGAADDEEIEHLGLLSESFQRVYLNRFM